MNAEVTQKNKINNKTMVMAQRETVDSNRKRKNKIIRKIICQNFIEKKLLNMKKICKH
jgi:hypothetical protein